MASFQSLDATVHKNITSTHSSTQLLLSKINPNCTINFFLGTLYRCNGGYILTVVRALHHLWSNKECTNVIVAGWRLRLRLRLRISFAVCLELGHWNFTGRTLIPVCDTLSALLKCKLNEDTICTEFAPYERTLRLARVACTSYDLCTSST